MRCLVLAAALAGLVPPLFAQDKPDPHIVVQLQPLAAWLGAVQHVTKDYPPALQKPLQDLLGSAAVKDVGAAIDVTKPLGLYIVLRDKIEQTELVALAPVKDEKAFWKLLEAHFDAKKQEKDGLFEVTLPALPEPVFVRFRDGYACVARYADSLTDAKLLIPARLFDPKQKALAVARGRVDRLPEAMRTDALAGVEEFQKNLAKGQLMMMGPYGKIMRDACRFGTLVLNGGGATTFTIDLNRTTNELALDATLTGKPGSELEKYYGDLKPMRSRFAGLLGPDATAFATQSYALATDFGSIPKELIPEMAASLQQALAKQGITIAVDKVEALLQKVLGCFDVEGHDSTYALFGSQAGKYVGLYAQHIKDGARADAALREFVNEIPKEVREKHGLRTTRVEGVNVHRFKLGAEFPKTARALFGGDDVVLAIRDDAVLVGLGADAAAKVRAGLALKPQPAPLTSVEVNAAGLWPLIERFAAEDKDAAAKAKKLRELLGEEKSRVRLLYLNREGGAALTFRAATDLRAALKLGLAIDAAGIK